MCDLTIACITYDFFTKTEIAETVNDLHGIPCKKKKLLGGCTRDSRVKTSNDNVETAKDVNNTPGSPKEKMLRVSEDDLHGIPCKNPM